MPDYPLYQLPPTPISIAKPDEQISEKEKFANNGSWFLWMGRWITYNFFNQFRTPFYRFSEKDIKAGMGEDLYRTCDEMIENFAFYYGIQQNKTYAYTEQIDQNQTIQAVYIPDQKIRQLVDHATGVARKMIDPIPKSFSATILSENFLKEHNDLKKKLEIKKVLSKLINDDAGVSFAPGGIQNVDADTDIEKILEEFTKKQTLDFVRTAQGLFYDNSLKTKLEQSALHELVGNVSTFMVDVDENDQTQIEFYPCYNSIVDTRATDDYMSNAMCSGGVKFSTAAEVISKYRGKQFGLDDDQCDHINAMCNRQYSNITECYNYYNGGWGSPPSVTWWERGKVSVARCYWIGKKDLRYRIKDTRYGRKLQWLEDQKDYAVVENGKPKMNGNKIVTEKGEDIKGDGGGWFVHQVDIIGNCYPVNYGYHKIQIRSQGKQQKPLLPTVQYVHRMNMGYARSLVSRLRQFAEERGMLKLKIQELVGKDMGNVYLFWAHKVAQSDQTMQQIYKDWKSIGASMINTTGEEGSENGTLTAQELNFSLQQSVMAYIQLVRECAEEMQSIVNMPSVSLGTQTDIIGKSVQQNSINQASLGQLSLYTGLAEHWRLLMEYSLNVAKTINAGKEKTIRTGDNESYLVNIAKKLQWSEIGLRIEFGDPNDEIKKNTLLQGLFAFNQNGGTLEAAEALLTTVKLTNFNSTIEGEAHLEDFVANKKKEVQQQIQQEQQADIQGQGALQQQQQLYTTEMEAMKLAHKDWQVQYQADVSALSKLVGDMEKQNTAMAQMLLKQMNEQPPVAPIEAKAAMANEAQAAQ